MTLDDFQSTSASIERAHVRWGNFSEGYETCVRGPPASPEVRAENNKVAAIKVHDDLM